MYNNAGLYTQAYSKGTVIDSTPPSRGFVLDGLGLDIDFTKDLHNVSSHWDGFVDPHSDIREYEWGIGTCETCTDVRSFVSTALVKSKLCVISLMLNGTSLIRHMYTCIQELSRSAIVSVHK